MMNCTAMDDRVMCNRNIVSDRNRPLLIGAMDDSAILNVNLVSHPDGMDIATDNGIEPNTTLVTHHHIANNGCIVCKETFFTKLWCLSVYCFYQSHNKIWI